MTNELSGAELDRAVAEAVGGRRDLTRPASEMQVILPDGAIMLAGPNRIHCHRYSPSTDWSQGGPLIEGYRISLMPAVDKIWLATCTDLTHTPYSRYGPTPLVAAMRALVAAKSQSPPDA